MDANQFFLLPNSSGWDDYTAVYKSISSTEMWSVLSQSDHKNKKKEVIFILEVIYMLIWLLFGFFDSDVEYNGIT